MGIEIPPPTDGPAVFTCSPGDESLSLTPDEEGLRTPELGDELNDEGSLCLSEGEAADKKIVDRLQRLTMDNGH